MCSGYAGLDDSDAISGERGSHVSTYAAIKTGCLPAYAVFERERDENFALSPVQLQHLASCALAPYPASLHCQETAILVSCGVSILHAIPSGLPMPILAARMAIPATSCDVSQVLPQVGHQPVVPHPFLLPERSLESRRDFLQCDDVALRFLEETEDGLDPRLLMRNRR